MEEKKLIPDQGPDPYNSWKDAERRVAELQKAVARMTTAAKKASAVMAAASAALVAIPAEIKQRKVELEMLQEALDEATTKEKS